MHPFEKALDESNYRATFENLAEKTKEVLEGKLLFPYGGGYFKLDAQLFYEIKLYIEEDKTAATLLDINLNPIDVVDLFLFYNETRKVYLDAIKTHKLTMNRLKSSRKIVTMIKLHEIDDDHEE